MISFEFTEEQEAFRRTLARFAQDVLRPGYGKRASRTEFPWDIQRQLGSMGVLGIDLPLRCRSASSGLSSGAGRMPSGRST